MLGSKKSEKTIVTLTVAVVLFSMIAVCFPNMFSKIANEKSSVEYPDKLFGRDVINIEITADETDWTDMLENKMSKPYISCDLNIDGKTFEKVGLRPKGNSSLTSIQGDRISYRLDFDHYIDNQTCYGLEQMVLNNLQADATYMKDYIAYDLMAYEGVNAPLHTFAFISLNGKPFGLYLAVEVYDEDYLSRVYDNTDIKLYSVKSSGLDEFENALVDSDNGTVIESKGKAEVSGQGGPGAPPGEAPPQGMQPSPGGQLPQGMKSPLGGQPPQNMPMMKDGEPSQGMQPNSEEQPPMPNLENGENKGGSFGDAPPAPPGGNSGGGDLVYIDDMTESYSSIFANAVSKNAKAEDFAKVIRAIKVLNKENVSADELEKYWDIDMALRYLAVHTFMVNGDSYTGNMQQNYYLAEQNGRITILPWDYNLSFGAFGGGPGGAPGEMPQSGENGNVEDKANETVEVINHAIDTPTIGVDMQSRPLVSVLLSNEEYKERYHNYLEELTQYTAEEFINKLETVESEIYPYVKKETVCFYTPEEHKTAFEVLKSFLALRSQSIKGQLCGEIPSETDKQNGANLVTADFSINDMGSMGGAPGGPGEPPEMSAENQNGEQDKMMPPEMPGGNGTEPAPPGMPGTEENSKPNYA